MTKARYRFDHSTTLKESWNDSLEDLWKLSSSHTNSQYDVFKSTKEVLNDLHSNQEDTLQHHLTSQHFFFLNIVKHSSSSVNSLWLSAQSHLPKNICNFTICYINNFLPTCKNVRMGLSQSLHCSILLLVVNIALFVLPGATTQFSTSLPTHFNW